MLEEAGNACRNSKEGVRREMKRLIEQVAEKRRTIWEK